MASIVGPELLEDAIRALTRAGGYQTEQEEVQHIIREVQEKDRLQFKPSMIEVIFAEER